MSLFRFEFLSFSFVLFLSFIPFNWYIVDLVVIVVGVAASLLT